MRAFDCPGRSAVYATDGMAATSHPLATSSALNVLREGGNAVDAALSAVAVLGVVEPHMTGVGGDCFAIIHEPDGTLRGLNGSGRAAAGADLNWYLERQVSDLDTMPAHTVTVPAAVKAWEALQQRYGTFGLDRLMRDAIRYAKDGFAVAPRVSSDWQAATEKLSNDEGATRHYLIDGSAPDLGSLHKLPNLATTLEAIASGGADVFYQGAIAAEIASTIQAKGGFLSEDDLSSVEVDWVDLISAQYGGYDVHQIPPNGQGLTALVLLRLLDQLGLNQHDVDAAERVHLEIEAARLAYAVRDAYVSDPATMSRSVNEILADDHIAALAATFNTSKRNDEITLPKLPDSDTVYLTVIDRDLRAISLINSVYGDFGSGIVTPQSGIVLQNRGACFVVEEGHDNAIGPSKRPMHTIIPGMVTKGGKLAWSFGVMGGAYQPMGHGHVLPNMIDYGMDPQEALDHPRTFWGKDDVIEVERPAASSVVPHLEACGHPVRVAPKPLGGGQIIGVDHANGVMIGGSDPRKDGLALGI
ncbi:MAG: gamma-glutamyltransferase family protein [Pseudomonadota bacterium]